MIAEYILNVSMYVIPNINVDGQETASELSNHSLFLEQSVAVTRVCSYSLDLYDVHNPTIKYRRMGSVPSNQIGLRIQILNNNNDGSSNLNRLVTGTVTLINSIGTTVSNISISE